MGDPATDKPQRDPEDAASDRTFDDDPARARAGQFGTERRLKMTVKGKYGGRKVRDGTVVSDKMQKTVLVAVEEHVRHRLYKKRVRRLHRFMAHDEREDSKMGDRVRIVEAAPISRRKRWRVVEILHRAELPEVAPESIDLDLLGEVKRGEEATPVAAPVAEAAGDVEEIAVEPEPGATAEESPPEPEETAMEGSAEEAGAGP